MTTFSIQNFGCRATDADAAALRGGLLAQGLTLTREHARADVVVLNTCTVTAAADSQARDAIRKIHRANPSARIVVTGCYAQRAPEEIAALAGVSWVIGNSHQTEIPRIVRDGLPQNIATEGATAAAGWNDRPGQDFIPVDLLDGDPMSLARGPAKILTGDIF